MPKTNWHKAPHAQRARRALFEMFDTEAVAQDNGQSADEAEESEEPTTSDDDFINDSTEH